MIIFSEHVKGRLKLREIPRKLILDCVNNPDETTLSYKGRRTYRKKLYGKILEVVVSAEEEEQIVVTAYYL